MKNRMITLTVEHMKDGADGAVLAFELETVVVGKDADGDDITSCIVVPVVVSLLNEDAGPKLMPQVKMAFELLKKGIVDEGKSAPDESDVPTETKGISRKRWRDLCKEQGLAESETDEAFKKAFQRVRKSLLQADLIGILDCGFVYLIRKDDFDA